MKSRKKISSKQVELIKKLKIIFVHEEKYVINIKSVPDELLEETIELCRNAEILYIKLKSEDIKRLEEKNIQFNSDEFKVCFYCDYISQAPIELLDKYGIRSILVGARENQNVEEMGIEKYRAIYLILQEIASKVDIDGSEVEKFKEIYKSLAVMLEYDYAAIEDGSEYAKDNMKKSRNLENAVLLHKAVCMGFSETLKQVLSLVGIESKICYSIEGNDGIGHSYNLVKIDGKWYNADLTWDYEDIRKKRRPKYCLKSDKDFARCRIKDKPYHIADDVNVEKCNESLEIFEEYNSFTYLINKIKRSIDKDKRLLSAHIGEQEESFRERIQVHTFTGETRSETSNIKREQDLSK